MMMMGNLASTRAVNGYLYNFWAVSDANFAPTDWKVPTKTELETLLTYLDATFDSGTGLADVAGRYLKEAGTVHWDATNDADNSSGFTAFGSGLRTNLGAFFFLRTDMDFWTSTESDATNSFMLTGQQTSDMQLYANLKKQGNSVRLIKDDSIDPGTMTDYEGRVYDTITIGTQIWIKQNWACSKLNNGTDLTLVTDNSAWAALTTEGYCYPNGDINNV